MQLIATDILADLCGLSLGLILLVLPVGLVLWLLGWWSHRFWIVLTTTVLAGIVGLNQATSWRAQPIVVAVLLAIAAGVLALALVRLIAFLSGGVAGLYLVQMLSPALNQPVIVFLVSGLLSLLVFRWCFMALTSLLGSACLLYATLALLHYYAFLNALHWGEDNRVLLNGACGGAALLGFLFQMVLHRRRMRRLKEESGEGDSSMIAAVIGKVTGRSRKAA